MKKLLLLFLLLVIPAFGQDLRPSAYVGRPGVVTVRGGKVQGSTGGVTTIAGTDITPANNTTTYIYLDLSSTPVVATNTTGFPTANYFPICVVIKDLNGTITSFTDSRPDYFMAGGGSGTGGALNGTVNPKSFGAKFDEQHSGNCSWGTAASTTTVTCAGGDITFTAVDAATNKLCFGTTGQTQVNSSSPSGALTIPACTITGFISSTQVTVSYSGSSTACTPSSSIACTFSYATQDDSAAIIAARAAAWETPGAPCVLELPAGRAYITKPVLSSTAVINQCMGSNPNSGVLSDTTSIGPVVFGQGQGATQLILYPTYDFTKCTNGQGGASCDGATDNLHAHDFSVTGLQQVVGGTHAVTLWESRGSPSGGACNGGVTVWNMSFSGFGLTSASSTGFWWGNQMCNDSVLWNVNVSNFGANPCKLTLAGNSSSVTGLLCFGATDYVLNVNVASNGILNIQHSQFTSNFSAGFGVLHCAGSPSGTIYSRGNLYDASTNNSAFTGSGPTIICNGASFPTIWFDGDRIIATPNSTSNGLIFLNGTSTLHFKNSILQATGTNNKFIASLSATDSIYNEGGNTVTFGSVQSALTAGAKYINRTVPQITAACTGTVTASLTTGGIYGTGPNIAATACNASPNNAAPGTLGTGIVVQAPGTLQGLHVKAGTGGTNASSGVVTVMRSTAGGALSATTITCTIGTTTECDDFLHSVSVLPQDIISFQYTTQAADTLANISFSVDVNN